MSEKLELTKEEIVRAIVDPQTTPFSTISIQELEKTTTMLTPEEDMFTPMLTRLKGRTETTPSFKFEWNDIEVSNVFSGSLYDGYVPPTSNTTNPTRRDNYVMPLSRVATVSRFTNAFTTVDKDAMTNEMRDRYLELKRSVEYYIWNGDKTITAPCQQTDGIKKWVTASVNNATTLGVAQVIQEANLKTSLIQIYGNGFMPRVICATPPVSNRIADFSLNASTVRPVGFNGNVPEAFTYRSPFGFNLTVVPVLEDFLGTSATGDVFVLDDSKISLVIPEKVNALMNSEPLGTNQHGKSVIMFSFFGVKVKAHLKAHRKITNVLNQ